MYKRGSSNVLGGGFTGTERCWWVALVATNVASVCLYPVAGTVYRVRWEYLGANGAEYCTG